MPRTERDCIKGAKEEEEWASWRAQKPELARANSRVGTPSWRANYAVGARQVPSWRANFDLASKKLASTQKPHILQHINKATLPKAVKPQ